MPSQLDHIRIEALTALDQVRDEATLRVRDIRYLYEDDMRFVWQF